MTESIIDKISAQTGCDGEKIAEIVTIALRELHMVSATDSYVTTGALMECRSNFGSEAAYHLGGILTYQDDGTNETIEPGYTSESLMPETMLRLLGHGLQIEDIKARWFQYLQSQRGFKK